MSTLSKLKELAASRRSRVRDCLKFSANVEEPIVAETSFTFRRRKLSLAASEKQFQIDVSVKTELFFSVGRPNLVSGFMEAVAKVERTGSVVFAQKAYAQSARTWVSAPENIAILEQRPLRPDEALHVFRNGLHWVVNQESSLDDQELSWLDAIATALARSGDQAQRAPSASTTETLESLPPELATLLKRFGRLAEGDDDRREQLTEEMDAATTKAFLAFVTPLFPLINDYLGSLPTPWPEAASRISNLGELASELAIQQRER